MAFVALTGTVAGAQCSACGSARHARRAGATAGAACTRRAVGARADAAIRIAAAVHVTAAAAACASCAAGGRQRLGAIEPGRAAGGAPRSRDGARSGRHACKRASDACDCARAQAARASAAQRREFTTADFRQLFSYCRHGKYRQAKDLLKGGCPVDGRDQFGNTPLIIACQNSHARLVKALLRHGAAVDAANRSGNTGLHYAVAFGFTPLADFLISQGANDKVRNAAGLTPYEGIK